MQHTTAAMGNAVALAFKKLLSEKHLYQSVEVDKSFVTQTVREDYFEFRERLKIPLPVALERKSKTPTIEEFAAQAEKIVTGDLWFPHQANPKTLTFREGSQFIRVDLPTVNTFCEHCQERWPFNLGLDGCDLMQGSGQNESFYLAYECQQCKKSTVRFLVCRENLRLRLAGRYPIEQLPTPKVLPKILGKYYGDALIAHHAGQTLAGLFLLRVAIEQFWRTVTAVKDAVARQPKATGDEQGSAYQSTLPDDFKSRFPSLKDIYGQLSAAIHIADANAVLFDDTCTKIVEHFEARKLFRLN